MGKPTGFLEYQRQGNPSQGPMERIQHFDEFHPRLGREERRRQGYRSLDYYQQDPVLKRVLDQISAGFSDGRSYTDLTNRLHFGGGGGIADEYMLLADFDSYCQAHRRSLEVYKDRRAWDQKSLINIARSGIFAADRSIRDYARDIWHVPTRFD